MFLIALYPLLIARRSSTWTCDDASAVLSVTATKLENYVSHIDEVVSQIRVELPRHLVPVKHDAICPPLGQYVSIIGIIRALHVCVIIVHRLLALVHSFDWLFFSEQPQRGLHRKIRRHRSSSDTADAISELPGDFADMALHDVAVNVGKSAENHWGSELATLVPLAAQVLSSVGRVNDV